MGQLTANKARLYDNIEAGLHLVAPLIDRLENHYGCDDGLYLARATLGKAFASLELLRAEMAENRNIEPENELSNQVRQSKGDERK